MRSRPPATVIAPFAGSQEELERLRERLATIERTEEDEILVADNRPGGDDAPAGDVRVLAARGRRSSYFARNVAARVATGEWLVFVDADTAPADDLLARYFDPEPADDVAVLAGAIRDVPVRDTRCARYVLARAKMDQNITLAHPHGPYAQTANCAVRRSAFEAVGGFADGIRSGGDADLCWRLAQAGWRLEQRPAALVEHRARERFRELFAQLARHGSGLAWLEQRHPGAAPRPRACELLGRLPHYARAALRAPDRESALFALTDLAALYARDAGRLRSNRAR